MGQIMLNGIAYAGADGGACGCFVDTSNVIKANSAIIDFPYVATQDCAVYVSVSATNAGVFFSVDGEYLYSHNSSASYTYTNTIFLRRGQSLDMAQTGTLSSANYTVYGVIQGLDSTAQSRYSTSEKAVGVWIDGSIVYEKVVDLGTLPNATTKNVAHGISNFGILVSADFCAYDSQGYRFPFPYTVVDRDYFGYQVSVSLDATNIIIVTDADRSAYSGYAILRYTKSST